MRTPSSLGLSVLMCIAVMLATGCSAAFGPLYRDFEVQEHDESVDARIERALEEAGWSAEPAAAPNAIKTSERTFNRMLLYRTRASLEIVPIGDSYVRVMIHPYRYPFVGQRNKLPYLPRVLRRKALNPLRKALTEEGFEFTPSL